MKQFFAGLKNLSKTQKHMAERPILDYPVCKQWGTTRLLDAGQVSEEKAGESATKQGAGDQEPVLVLPSLINRASILDLNPANSLIQNLRDRGFRPYILDWGEPGEQERSFGLGEYVSERVTPAMTEITKLHPSSKPHLIGHCMGGALALAYACLHQNKLESLTLLAAPWDFSKFSLQLPRLACKAIADGLKLWPVVPQQLLQFYFFLSNPMQVFNKYKKFGTDSANLTETQEQTFAAVELWVNDGVPLSRKVAEQCLLDWFSDNQTYLGEWLVGGKAIDPASLKLPVTLVASDKDSVVPKASTLSLQELIPEATIISPELGHIGMLTSKKAAEQVWDKLIRC